MKKFWNNLKTQAEEKPLAAIAVATVAVTVTAKLINANTEHMNSKTWAKEVDRRRMNSIK
jgi:hypothetical protein